MNELIKKITGMGDLTDQVVATDFLISTKAGVRNLAFAITETSSPELRHELRNQLRVAIDTHATISSFMIEKGFYYPHQFTEQTQLILQTSDTAINVSEKMH